MTDRPPFPYAGEAAAIASSLLWACAGIVFRRMKGRAEPGAMNLAKNTVAAACLVPVLLFATGSAWPTGMSLSSLAFLAASGVVGLSLCDTFYLRAILEIGPRKAALVMTGTVPVLYFGAVALPPWSQSLPSSPWPWAGLVLAIVGVVLATRELPEGRHDAASRWRGLRDALVSAFLQTAGLLLALSAAQAGTDPRDATFVRLVAGSGGLVVGALVFRRTAAWTKSLSTRGVLPRLAIAAFFGTFLGIWANQAGIAWSAHSGVATTLNSLSPVWLIPLSTVFLGERHGRAAWLSTLVALAGVSLLLLR